MADGLCAVLQGRGESASVVPMDGFHLDNTILEARGLLPRKGAPQTFDADGFLVMVKRLHAAHADVVIPVFDRTLDKAIAGASLVSQTDRFVIVEGNYLLLNDPPWNELPALFDRTVFIDTPMEELRARLVRRWLDHGLDAQAAEIRAQSNDLPNAEQVVAFSVPADITISQQN